MLDENLPTFFLKPSTDKLRHHESFYFTQNGSEPDAQYALHHVDPASNEAKNTYAVALFDAHSPEILYGEVLAKPGWSCPTLSQEEIRRNGGVPPPPQPIYPTEFAIQLYNPDSQVVVRQQTTKWSSTASWEFSLPQVSFRTPSNSHLDRTLGDPAASAHTPQVNFIWKKEGRIGKDMTCYMTGKSTDPTGKKAKKSKEPDIAVALFSGLKEMSIMEPNLYRIELEDYKGLEVVLLLSAAVIRDLFFSDLNEQFHINNAAIRKNSGGLRARKGSSPLEGPHVTHITKPVKTPKPQPPPSQYPPEKGRGNAANSQLPPPAHINNSAAKRSSLPPLATNHGRPNQVQPQLQRPSQQQQVPPPQPGRDPRALWEIEVETARLKALAEAEARRHQRQEEAARKMRRKQEAEEERKTLKFLEDEAKQKEREDAQRRQDALRDQRETEQNLKRWRDQLNRLGSPRRADHVVRPSLEPQRHSAPLAQGSWSTQRPIQPHSSHLSPVPALPPRVQSPYLQAGQGSFFGDGRMKPQPQPLAKAKKSFWGLRTQSDTGAEKLQKKKSRMF